MAQDLTHLQPRIFSRDLQRGACDLPARSGQAGGVCTATVAAAQEHLSFCRSSVRYRACVPAHQPPWEDWNASAKDALLGSLFKDMVEKRLAREMNNSPDEYVTRRLLASAECSTALRRLLCWFNFPKCDDSNRSLPLCRSSCRALWRACRFPMEPGGGAFGACGDEELRSSGFLLADVSNIEQVLADDTAVCESTARAAESILVGDEDEDWLFGAQGIVILLACSLLMLACAYWLLVPEGFQAFLAWALKRALLAPLRLWRALPSVKGNAMLWSLLLVFLVLLVLGVHRRLQAGAGDGGGSLAKLGPEGFVPPASAHRIEALKPLSGLQLRQLVGSCSCTGAARRSSLRLTGLLPALLFAVGRGT